MRTITKISLMASAVLLSGCVGGFVWPGDSDDSYSVDVDGPNPQTNQQMADEKCSHHDNMRAQLKSTSTEPNGMRHDHYDCIKRNDHHRESDFD